MKKQQRVIPPWLTRPISPTCEVLTSGRNGGFCDRVTDYAYPAMGGGWMALCARHAAKHHPYCTHIAELIEKGERFEA